MKILLLVAMFLLFPSVFASKIYPPTLEQSMAYSVASQVNNIGVPEEYNVPHSINAGSTLDASFIADKYKALSSEQVCISLGKFNNANWQVINDGKAYKSVVNQAYSFKVICDRSLDLVTSINDFQDQTLSDGLKSCQDFDPTKTSRYCLAVLSNEGKYYKTRTTYSSQGFLSLTTPLAIISLAALMFALLFGFQIRILKHGGIGKIVFHILSIIAGIPFFGLISTLLLGFIFYSLSNFGDVGYWISLVGGILVIAISAYLIKSQIKKQNSQSYSITIIAFVILLMLISFLLLSVTTG